MPAVPFVRSKMVMAKWRPTVSKLCCAGCQSSTGEIENLVDEFHGLREKLQTDLSRIQRDLAKYRELSQAVIQLAASISDSMKELPGGPRIV